MKRKEPWRPEDLQDLHSRTVVISDRFDEYTDRQPFILAVDYIETVQGGGGAVRAIELDNCIMPIIQEALKKYLKNRIPENAKWQVDHDHEGDTAKVTSTMIYVTFPDGSSIRKRFNGKMERYSNYPAQLDYAMNPRSWEKFPPPTRRA